MHFQKFISFILSLAFTVSLCLDFLPQVHAADDIIIQDELVDILAGGWSSWLAEYNLTWRGLDFIDFIAWPRIGRCSYAHFTEAQSYYNESIAPWVDSLFKLNPGQGFLATTIKAIKGELKAVPVLDEDLGVYRLADSVTGYYLVDNTGKFPYCEKSIYESAVKGGAKPSVSYTGKWIDYTTVQSMSKGSAHLLTGDRATVLEKVMNSASLSKRSDASVSYTQILMKKWNAAYFCVVQRYSVEKPIPSEPGSPVLWGDIIEVTEVWCDPSGSPYLFPVSVDNMASQNPVTNNYTEVTNKTENSPTYNQTTIINNNTSGPDYSGTLLDINNNVLNLIDEVGNLRTEEIYNVTYDNSDHSYHVTTYNQTFNQTNNYYEYNYYTYNIQYTYNNTYITYIGSTAEYQPKEWELYYELPDGRSSADLTEDDVAGLSFQFNDCINYKKSATDTALRALYHFDGNTNDSGFFSNKTAFTWNTGASITYMDVNAFDGALYLDEKAHKFTITLPSNIGSGDFTLQWRYYQNSATTTDHNENYINVGGTKMLGWSEQSLYNGSGTKLAGLSVGTWQELAIVRHNGTVYLYHNGVKIGNVSNSSVLTNKIIFYLGANSRAHSMLDEMRFVKGALYTGGKAYTPTSVPYDTNAVLVLPDSPTPVVDSYWSFDKTITPLKSWDFMAKPGSFYQDYSTFTYRPDDFYGTEPAYSYTDSYSSPADYLYYSGSAISLTDTALHIGNGLMSSDDTSCPSAYDAINPVSLSEPGKYPYYTPVSYLNGSFYIRVGYRPYIPISALQNGTYTFTAVFADGSIGSATITLSNYFSLSRTPNVTEKKNGYDYSGYCDRNSYPGPISLSSGSNKLNLFYCSSYAGDGNTYSWEHRSYNWLSFSGDCDLVYLEICQGSKGNTNHQYIIAEYDPTELQPNTAAIQTDIPIKGYTVGGVRPTFPERGDVWMPVEGSRIAGVQIYNGQAWEETNARWWTGSRWIPIYAFDLVTLADMWDVTSSGGSDVEVTPPITSETGFWNWWKKAWNDFTGKLFSALQGGSGPGGSPSGPSASPDPDASPSPSREPSDYDTLLPGETPDPEDPEGGESWRLFDLLGALKDAGWTIVKGTVTLAFDGIGGIVGAVVDVGGFFSGMGDLKHDMKDIGGGDWNWTP